MRFPILAGLIVSAAALMGSSAAFAGPTACFAGICVPTGGTYLDNSLSAETLVQSQGDVLSGVFKITAISDGALNQTYAGYGAGGVFLAGYFTGFTLKANPVTNQLFFTGGSLKYYVSSTDNLVTNLGVTNDINNIVNNGQLWASFDAVPDINGNTLVITLNGTPLNFTGAATDDVFLDVDAIPGIAGSHFDTATQLDTNSILRDLKFAGTASGYNGTPCTTDFQICGANSAKGQVVPEPFTLSLFGAGLAGVAAVRRRKSKKA